MGVPQAMRVLNMFIASPGGVAAERDAVEAVAGRLNASLGRIHGMAVMPRRYEQIVGDAGNAQSQINLHADEADIFIGIIHRRWGSDTGNGFDSGFHEEFTRALERWKTHRTPRIALFFKDVDAESLADPGAQLAKVLEFKGLIEADHVAFYNRFATPAELEGMVTSLVAEQLAQLSRTTRAPEGEGATPTEPLVVETPDPREPISLELAAVFRAFEGVLGGQDSDTPLDLDRLELFALAVSRDSDGVPTHLANRLYARREELNLIHAERRIWFREYLRDVGRSNGPSERVIPFPAVVDREWIAKTLGDDAANLLRTEDFNLRLGAIRLMRRLQIRPRLVWPRVRSGGAGRAELIKIWRPLAESSSKAELIRYWLSVRRQRDFERASALATAEGSTGDIGHALEGLLAPEPSAASAAGIDANLLIDPLVRACFPDGAPERTVSDEKLAQLVDRSYISTEVRALALRELANRDRVPASMVNSLLESRRFSRWGRIVDEVLLDREVGPNFIQAFVTALHETRSEGNESERQRRAGDIVATLARRNPVVDSALSALAEPIGQFNENALRRRLIRHKGNPDLRSTALAVLNRTDPGFRVYIDMLEAAGWAGQTMKFVLDRVDLSALAYLRSLPGSGRDPVFMRHVRSLARDDTSLFRGEALGLMAVVANDSDMDVLLQNTYALDDFETTVPELLRRASLKRLRAIAIGDDERLAPLALSELSHRDRPLTRTQLVRLLRSTIAAVRMNALEQLSQQLTQDQLGELAASYVHGKGTHYYNVVSAVDERLAAMPA